MTYSYTFNLKSPSSKTPSLIFLRASIKGSGKYLKYSTGEKILPKNWDPETKFPIRLKGRSNDAVQINSVIKQLTRYGESFQLICSRLEAQGIDLDVDRIRKELDHEFKKDTIAPGSFEAVFDEFLSEKRDLGKIAPQTVQRYVNIRMILSQFSKWASYPLNFGSINEKFYVKFVKFSRKQLKHKDNTLGRNLGFIKTFMNWAAHKGYHSNLAYLKFEKISSETDEIALSMEELEGLWTYDFSKSPRLERVRDVFVFGCTTGMRYSDYSRIGKSNIRNGQIFINTQKQKSNLGVPLNKYSKAVLEKYDYNLPLISPQKFRDYVKEVCMKVGLVDPVIKTSFIGNQRIEEHLKKYEMISTHTARRTFITLSLENGMRPDIVMSITGHKSYSSFKKYIKLSQRIREEEMNKAWS